MDYQELYENLFSAVPCGIVQLELPIDKISRIYKINKKASDVLGIEDTATLFKTEKYFNEDNLRYIKGVIKDIKINDKRKFLIQLFQGTLEGEVEKIQTPDCKEVLQFTFLEIGREIAVRRREAAQKELLSSVLQSVNCGVLRFGFTGDEQCITIVNDAGWKMLGFENEEECIQKGMDGFMPRIVKADRSNFIKSHCSLGNKKRTASSEFRIIGKDGETRWLHAEEQALWDSKRNYMVQMTLSDITDAKLLEQQKDRENGEIIQSLGKIYNTILYVDAQNDTYRIIKGGNEKMKISIGECYSKSFELLKNEIELSEKSQNDIDLINLEKYKEKYEKNEHFFEHDYSVNFGGENKYYRIESLLSGNENKLEHITMGIRDVTGLRLKELKSQEMLRASYESAKQANEAKSDFFSRMSHDIRTPMNAIVGLTRIMENHIDERECIEDCIGKINESSQLLLELINEVLDMSRVEQGKMKIEEKPVALSELIERVGTIIKPEMDKHSHKFIVENKLPQNAYLGDQLRLQQILINLLSNAAKFTHDGGTVSLKCSTKQTSESTCDVDFIVSDNGIGMSEDFLKRIYKPFERGDNTEVSQIQGTGLGMSIVNNLVELMNGRIDVQSKENIGTTFKITLPMQITAAKTKRVRKSVSNVEKPDLSGRRVLIVEDNEINMLITNELIKNLGAEVDCAEDGQLALKKFESSAIHGYDLIIMDVRMPVMDGYTATRKIRELNRSDAKTIPIFAMTANAFAEDVHDALQAGMNCHLSKPIKVDTLYERISELVLKKNTTDKGE